ncbi:hypothetical protein ACFOLC_12950 [Lysobacter cavernae]|uniref:Uncharacterized protein n=1 Tax=Lysobacter cavernae TaxID=1685901 RepID=A0ABV7RTD6_9GAMM
MNVIRLPLTVPTSSTVKPAATLLAAPVRHLHRERDFGIGYGNSSGYASARRYIADWAPPRFRCA